MQGDTGEQSEDEVMEVEDAPKIIFTSKKGTESTKNGGLCSVLMFSFEISELARI